MKNQTFFLALLVLLASCQAINIKTQVPYRASRTIGKMVLFPVIIGEFQQPILPLIDAAGFNKKTNNIADQIMDIQKKAVDKYRENSADILKKYFKCEILYGDSLQSMDGYLNLSKTHHFKGALIVEDDNFPTIITSTGDINPFKFENGKVLKYFKDPVNYKETIKLICHELNTDALAISFSSLAVVGVTPFGMKGAIRLNTHLYVFDMNGSIIANGSTWSKPVMINGKELSDYQHTLDGFSLIFDPLVSNITTGK